MMELVGTRNKIAGLSKSVQQKIFFGERPFVPSPETPVSNFLDSPCCYLALFLLAFGHIWASIAAFSSYNSSMPVLAFLE